MQVHESENIEVDMKKSIFMSLFLLLMVVVNVHADIQLGVIPLEDKAIMEAKFAPLCNYLSNELGETVTLHVGSDYDEIEKSLVAGTIQAAYIGPVGAVHSYQTNHAVIPVVKVIKKGSPFYKSYVVALKDSPLMKVSDLKGKVFAFGDKGSTSSYLVPKYLLAKSGVKLADLKANILTGSHSNVIRAVLAGKAAAGGVKESVALKNQDKLKFLEISKPIPNFPICVNLKVLGKERAKKFQAALLKLAKKSPEMVAISKKYDGFVKASIGDYRIIESIMKNK
jgi:phosphonate transport system substrate-binding protein